jgi:signal transduction histidine kinase
MFKKILFLLAALWLCVCTKAQTSETDSLIHLLSYAKEDTNKVNLCWNIGASIIFQNPLQSLPYFKQGITIAKKLNYYSGIEKCYNGASLSYSYNANYDSALVYIDSAMPYAHKVGNIKRLSLVYLNRADYCANLQHFNIALKDCDTAIKYAEQINNKDGLGRIYSIIGGIYVSQNQYQQALASYDKSIEYFIETNNRQMIAMQYSDKADAYAQNNEPAKAIPLLKIAIQIGDSLQDIENLSAYTSGLAQAYLLTNQLKEAEVVAGKALEYAKQAGNIKQQAIVYEVFSQINIKRERHAEAIAFELKAYNILSTEKDLLRERTSSTTLADEYFKTGNTEEAYKYLKISRDLNDSLIKMQFSDETARLQTTLQVSQKDKEIQLLHKNKQLQEEKIKQQRTTTIAVIIIALLVLIGIALFMNRNRLRQRMKEVEIRNKIASDLHDDVGSTLSSIRMYSDIVKHQPNQTETSTQLLDKISTNSKEMIENMSDIVWMIKPGNDEFVNIENRMLNFANELCVPAGINFEFNKNTSADDIKIPMEIRRDIYLIFKEAVNNAVKYSGCKNIRANISMMQYQLHLRIEDDGNGFNIDAEKKGNGLSNMQKRTDDNKGIFKIISSVGEGTEILVSFKT